MQTYGNPDVTYGWWAGNAGVTNKSGKFIAAHIAHTGLIAFAAGGSTLWELARYNPEIPMGHQSSIFLAHLASIGIGFDEAGAWTGAGVASIAIVHLVLSMVYGAGGLLHSVLFVGDMQDSEVPQARKFKLEWDNPDNQTFILGHHLLFFGVACIWFVEWARIHGIYDPAIGAVRQVEYNLNLTNIWNHQFDFLAIDSLEDVLGGHAFLAFLEITGGAFHIATKQVGEYTKFKGAGLLSAEAILSFSCAGLGWMAVVAAFWCAQNTTVYPEAWYGEALILKFGIAPYWIDSVDLSGGPAFFGHTTRAALANVHYYFGFFFLQGHLWHALRAMGFDFKRILKEPLPAQLYE
ncbi:chlorophyll a/b binding light-harvesting protein [Prochlorococcus marinus XMU1403]|mgnify:FL=1|jgi:chlorophyll a/b binding light-harvesting protein PcbB/chlorophyll a/b binding light-harvesting protein PcbF|nr:chlorophyll a/b binding light-harvesting protein [Prochlorococcus marinus]MAJ25658.1 chlorophyll a/b binding light-harvesting protein [Prochlorococcus sp. MED630]MBW3049777.1 chlorophyll a/b binding light-harvesting protein [Prochlorococcus marinus str. MU1403]PYE01589.1 chlorophyll a/b binding light-harvesting protein [Prochlorococcus marinus XMU1403]|tara:strand:- start:6 stop:1055 length:1050 start_codon:yes stop_codon:yes gene_type:complete